MMKQLQRGILFGLLLLGMQSGMAQDGPVVMGPSLHPKGGKLAFSYQGDIWVYDISTKTHSRITVHPGYESAPVWSADGKSIAFNGARFGNTDVFVAEVATGNVKQLTYNSSSDNVTGWSGSNQVLFSTVRTFAQLEWDSEIYAVNTNGTTPFRILNAVGGSAVESPDGNLIAFTRGACRTAREDYSGPADQEIWVYNKQTKAFHAITNNLKNDYLPKFSKDGSLYFLSAMSGRYNIVKQTLESSGAPLGSPKAITQYKGDGVVHFDLSQNAIVFTKGVEQFLMQLDGQKATKLNLQLPSDSRFDRFENKTLSGNATGFDISPNGKSVAMIVRGELFIKANDKEKKKSQNITKNQHRESEVHWVNDSTVVFLSERNGQKNIYLARSADENYVDMARALKSEVVQISKSKEEEVGLALSSDGQKIAFVRGQKLIVADLDLKSNKLKNEKVLRTSWALPYAIQWSPDNLWLAYNCSDLNFNAEVYIQPIDMHIDPVNVSMHPRSDYSPQWSPDGSKLAFVSNRINDYDVYYVWLNKAEWQKTKEDREYGLYGAEEESKDKKEKDKAKEPLKIAVKDLYARTERVTSMEGDEFEVVFSKDGEYLFFTTRAKGAKGSDIYKVKWDGSETKQLTKSGPNLNNLRLSPDLKSMYGIKSGAVVKVDPGSGKLTFLPHKARLTIDSQKENLQVFEEATTELKQGFYDPQFHGYDYDALVKKYKPWVLATSTKQDFRYYFNLMLGQLNASHMGFYGGNPEKTKRIRTGKLGVELKPVANGVEVVHVIANGPADRTQSKLAKGDIITHVNGTAIAKDNVYRYLNDQVKEEVLLTVQNAKGQSELVIRPIASLGNLLYEEWVASRKALVDQYSNGQLGYIHIRGMNMTSFERFERELQASGYGKKGIVIDVRYNGGGWTTDYLMAILNVRQHAYTVPRGAAVNLEKEHTKFEQYYPYSERLPLSWWTKPSIALCNESSYSNAEIFSHAFKHLGIGKLVGMPTFGAVISTSGHGMVDGSFIRMPFRAWYVKATGENMENGPAVPDVLVENQPDSKAKGDDPQLKKSVEILLKDIK